METPQEKQKQVLILLCSYPTYEEWKLEKSGKSACNSAKVLILPMRNGNYKCIQKDLCIN